MDSLELTIFGILCDVNLYSFEGAEVELFNELELNPVVVIVFAVVPETNPEFGKIYWAC